MGLPGQVVVRRQPNWPFMYTYEGGRIYRNPAPRAKKPSIAHMEDALL